ncbi:hypothetical protein KIK06_23885 [Nocardiopsis sp. EMB25]|uniref:hypothetical protein n=1 Tax=Nocardiopsis sp. EMB25 TaxID=2835867 RepID=UPI002283604E|nr:hypothetical protein [Nocardiopsis sp. EMB25]MCY9786929.1 hypothetical protein [Nocardiopsis sp. EMB25]
MTSTRTDAEGTAPEEGRRRWTRVPAGPDAGVRAVTTYGALAVRRDEALKQLYAALRRADVPGTRLDLYGEPAVYTRNTRTRVLGRYFLTQRVLDDGSVLETGSVPVQYTDAAVGLVRDLA